MLHPRVRVRRDNQAPPARRDSARNTYQADVAVLHTFEFPDGSRRWRRVRVTVEAAREEDVPYEAVAAVTQSLANPTLEAECVFCLWFAPC